MLIKLLVLLQALIYCYAGQNKMEAQQPAAKFDNPNYVRDRLKHSEKNKHLSEIWNNRYKKEFNSAWMDYCDPHHCNDYHKRACGLNRIHLKFQWFQSVCHLIINNMCATYRGFMKFDIVDTKFCGMYVLNLRGGCPQYCDDEMAPTCAVSTVDNHTVLFKNRCALEMANCREDLGGLKQYEAVEMAVCEYYLRHVNVKTLL